MDPKSITSFAKLLRDNGDKVLNSEFKLSLSGQLLRALNDSFTLIADQSELCSPQSFQVVKPNNSKSEVFRDLQLIHDFIQKTTLLCITHFPGDDCDVPIDITKFRNLKRLEVQKVNIKQICGIQPLRAQLQHLICIRSLEKVDDIISYCGKDNSNGFVWNELKIADFSYNNLRTVDCSLEFAQWLQNLNLSHNQLISCEAIKWLPNLKILNLSFNQLQNIPYFHVEASRRLQILNINNNFIEDLNGISRLDGLNELDLSDNCLLDHSSLLPLSTLVALRYLNLYGNPLYCHPKHRIATANYLHKNTASVKFILDFEPLSKVEKSLTGRYQSYHSVLLSRFSSTQKSSGTSTPSRRSQASNTPASSVGSIQSFQLNNSTNDLIDSQSEQVLIDKNMRKRKVRTVEIEDSKNLNLISLPPNVEKKQLNLKDKNQNLLDTKKQIEDFREKYGSSWLQSENAQIVHSVLGIDTFSVSENPEKISSEQLMSDLLRSMNIKQNIENTKNSPDNISPGNNSTSIESQQLNQTSEDIKSINTTHYESACSDKINDGNYTIYNSAYGEEHDSLNSCFKDDICSSSHIEEAEISEAEANEFDYIVYRKDSLDELFLTVSDFSIKEKDCLTKRTIVKWNLKILESCDRIKSNTLRINFDTIKRDKKERVYTVEENLCQQLEKRLRAVLSKRQLSEMNQTIYRCVNCTLQFAMEFCYEFKRKNLDVSCPECQSKFVVEVIETPKKVIAEPAIANIETSKLSSFTTTQSNNLKSDATQNLNELLTNVVTEGTQSAGENCNSIEESASHSSIGSAGSLNESSSCTKISNSQSSFDSNQSVAGSSTNDREINEFPISNNYYCDSDVEILSNPSQSSIEVLDPGSQYHSSRKTSEERRISRIPSLNTIEDQSLNINEQINQGTLTPDNSIGLNEFLQNEIQRVSMDMASTPTVNNNSKDMLSMQIHSNLEKKNINLERLNLTESSSSGSITDSICTTYEQTDKNDSIEGAAALIDLSQAPKKEDSYITTVLGGLFQSTNILMSRSNKITDNNEIKHYEKFKYNFVNFNDIDHRIKFYFYQSKFIDQNEHFKWLVKSKIFNENTEHYFEGIAVMSTTKFYLMEIFGPEQDDISKWLKQVFSMTVDRIESVHLLPFKIGLSFKIKGWGVFLLILQDILRTDSLLLFLANNPLPSECNLDYQISNKILNKLSQSTHDDQLKMFSVLNECEINFDNNKKIISPTCFFTTDNRLYITTSNISWLSNNSNININIDLIQQMSNLVEVYHQPLSNEFEIFFLDETQDKNELWKCTFETKENAESCLQSIGNSWEKLFGVPLIN